MAGKRREWSLLPRVSPFRDDAGMMCGFAVVRRPVGVAVSGGFGCPVVWCAGCARFGVFGVFWAGFRVCCAVSGFCDMLFIRFLIYWRAGCRMMR